MLVSVIIPCYNVATYIEECVSSVLHQTHNDIQIICIDDCSADNTFSILQSCKKKYPGINVIKNEKNMGASYSRNIGLAQADGEYVQFLDADDLLMPQKIANQIRLISNLNYKPDLIIGNYFWNDNGKIISSRKFSNNPWIDLLRGAMGNTCSNLWKKETLVRINGWNPDLRSSQETDLMFRLMQINSAILYDTALLTVINKGKKGSISKTDPEGNVLRFIDLRIAIMNYLIKQKLFSKDLALECHIVLFNAIRSMFKYNRMEALNLFAKYIPRRFPVSLESKTSFFYKILFILFGFEFTENIICTIQNNK